MKLSSLIILLIPGFMVLSCKKPALKPVNEVTVPDFKTLSSLFRNPPAEYTTAPFFVWNADITKEEIEKDLVSFKNAGSSQVFVHPRPGLITEYLSDKWFDLFKFAVDKGKELGMRVWIYDENSYPSGFAGGHVPHDMPESYNQGQGLKMTRVDVLPDSCAKYFLCLAEKDGMFTDITASLFREKGKKGNYFLFSKTYNSKSDWYGGFSYVDLLFPGVTQKFISTTMSGYERSVGKEFGKTVPGTFTDEPQIDSPEGIRWTPDLFDQFRKEWHYDLETLLPSLYEETGDWKKVRHNYTHTLLRLFIERWSMPWHNYCEENGLKFTGHYWEHEWPNMRPGGDNMAMYAWHQQPAVDMLFNQWNDSTPGAQFGNIRSIKELASVANQTGRQRKLSETYGGSGWDLNFRDMKRNGDWEYALGVNLMNQHLTYFSMVGARKYDYPPTFDYHEPWWNDYRYLNEHFARLSLALSSGRQVNDILVLEPTTTAWLYDSYVKNNPEVHKIGQSFQNFVTSLEKHQVEYDLGSENIMGWLGSVSEGKLKVGNATYKIVIIPPRMENLDKPTFNLLRKFVSSGGTLIAFSNPTLVNGAADDKARDFFNSPEIIRAVDPVEIISGKLLNRQFTLRFNGGCLYHQRRVLSDGQLLFLVNSSLSDSTLGTVTTGGKDVLELNTFKGTTLVYPNSPDGEDIRFNFSLPPAGSLLLFIPAEKKSGYQRIGGTTRMIPFESDSPMKVIRDSSNAIMIDFCDITLGGENYQDVHVYNAADRVFRFYGFRNGNPWNTSVQYKTNIVERDTFGTRTGFTASYHFMLENGFDNSSMKAVVERPSLWKVSINGTELKPENGKWWMDRSFGVFSIGKLVRAGLNTLTLAVSPMKLNAEIEPVYILGDFAVKPAKKGWTLNAPPGKYTTGSWQAQGLPFYSWNMTYSREYNITDVNGSWAVELGKWNGTVAELFVNGNKAGIIAFPPYRADITGLLRKGQNIVEVKVTGSLRNLLGPHHNNPPSGIASPWSWRNVNSFPGGAEYRMIDYGLYENFTLLRGSID